VDSRKVCFLEEKSIFFLLSSIFVQRNCLGIEICNIFKNDENQIINKENIKRYKFTQERFQGPLNSCV